MSTQALRITRLQETNFKRLSAVDIRPGDRTLIILRGPNEAGKTSIVDGMVATLGGKKASPDVPIRCGEDSATTAVTLGDNLGDRYHVARSWGPNDRTYLDLVKYGSDGQPEKVPKPQTHLEDLVSDLAFDPLAFAKTRDAREQARLLFAAVGKSAEFEAAQTRRQHLYETRRQRNAERDTANHQLEASPDPAPGHDLHETTDEQFAAQLEQARVHNAAIAGFEAIIHTAGQSQATNRARIAETREHIEQLQAIIVQINELVDAAGTAAAKAQEQIAQAGQPIDTATIIAQIAHVRDTNQAARLQAQHRKALDQLNKADANATRADRDLSNHHHQLAKSLTATDLGAAIPGLAFDGQQITHNDLPFSQASGMRRLEVSTQVCMAANKSLRVMAIDEGDQLDDESLDRLKSLAGEHDYQLWMTAIRAGDETDADTLIVPVLDGQALGAAGNGDQVPPVPAVGPDPPQLQFATAATKHIDDL